MATSGEETPSRRLDFLARSKRAPAEFIEDRRSVYWVDYVPPTPGANGTTSITATPRVMELAKHRPPHFAWRGDRPTPKWPVASSALTAPTSERITSLSQHKNAVAEHKMERSPYMSVTDGARRARSTQRTEQLAEPKSRIDRNGYVYETEWGQYNPVPPAAMTATHTERIETLAGAKGYHNGFRDERPIQWQVENSALNAIATIRLQQLARPRSRSLIRDDYDPYKISPSAKRARCTPRVEELCVPIPRKIKAKKVM